VTGNDALSTPGGPSPGKGEPALRLLLINYEFPPLGGGGGNATANIAAELAAAGVEVRVLTSGFTGLPACERRNGFEIHRIPVLRRRPDRCSVLEMLTFLLSSLVCAPLLARRWRPDGTIAFFTIPCGPAAWLIRVLFGIPWVASLRGGDVPGFLPRQIGAWHRLTRPVILGLWADAAAVVANSLGLAELARQAGPKIPIMVLPNGVDTVRYRPVPERPRREDGGLRLLFVGRLVHQKGLDLLLEALAVAPRDVTLDIVGDGPEREALIGQAHRLGVSGRVRFLGWLDRDALPAHFQAADAFAFPSRDEGMPNAVLEAMACGLPVIATDVRGLAEVVVDGRSGWLVPPEDRTALAAAIGHCRADPALRVRRGAEGRLLAETRFSWRATALGYRDIFRGPSCRRPAAADFVGAAHTRKGPVGPLNP
jgi:glycosyltransferase involved in cell wall biosynthesis